MLQDYRLPIEANKDLLVEYGRAFAWINAIESLLGVFVHVRKKYSKEEYDTLSEKTLGQKLNLASKFLEPDLYAKLDSLNQKRILLAHSAVSEEIDVTDANKKTGKFVVEHKQVRAYLNKQFTDELIELAKEIAGKLHSELIKGVQLKSP